MSSEELSALAFEAAPFPSLVVDESRQRVLAQNQLARELFGDVAQLAEVETLRKIATRPVEYPSGVWVALSEGLRRFAVRWSAMPGDTSRWLLTLQPDGDPSLEERMRLCGTTASALARDVRNLLQAPALAGVEPDADFQVRLTTLLEQGSGALDSVATLLTPPRKRTRARIDVSALLKRHDAMIRLVASDAPGFRVEVEADGVRVRAESSGQAVLQVLFAMMMRVRQADPRALQGLRVAAQNDHLVLSVRYGQPRTPVRIGPAELEPVLEELDAEWTAEREPDGVNLIRVAIPLGNGAPGGVHRDGESSAPGGGDVPRHRMHEAS